MSSKITINISTQPDEESTLTVKREQDENYATSEFIPLPPEAEDIISGDSDVSSGYEPAPPQDSLFDDHELATSQVASPTPPKFLDEDSSVSADAEDMAPAPPNDHPAISEEKETEKPGDKKKNKKK